MNIYIVVVILKGLAEIAGLALVAQGLLYVLAGAERDANVFYRAANAITSPVSAVVRCITPRRLVPDPMVGWLTFFLLLSLWFALTLTKIHLVWEAARGLR